MDIKARAAQNLAARLLAEPWTPQAIAAGLDAVLGPGEIETREALIDYLVAFGAGTYPPAPHKLAAYLTRSDDFKPPPDHPITAVLDALRFAPVEAFADLQLAAFMTLGDLADWLGQSVEQLDWLTDERPTHRHSVKPPLQHYNHTYVTKRSGAPRLIEFPKPRLKAIQREILQQILSRVPVHNCAKGFVAGRSCLNGAQVHAAEAVVATFDLAQCFSSIGLPRVDGLFLSLGYPWAVARRLAG